MMEIELMGATHYVVEALAYKDTIALFVFFGMVIGVLIGWMFTYGIYSQKLRNEYTKTLTDKEYRMVKEYSRR